MSKDLKLQKTMNQEFCYKKARKSEAYAMKIPARLIQATLSPGFIAPSIERTHYTTEPKKNQDYLKVIFLAVKMRNISLKFQLLLNKKVDKLEKVKFKLIKNELPIMRNSSAYVTKRGECNSKFSASRL
ncbi:hypothetical protein [Anaerotignum sp.]|uniref:hypothetical protein n=1 Tax=Anaerotignum sp. TaxID=2039241 RepID=UPI002714764F|nr:hypothetical protein [Anaerotignum sp.]